MGLWAHFPTFAENVAFSQLVCTTGAEITGRCASSSGRAVWRSVERASPRRAMVRTMLRFPEKMGMETLVKKQYPRFCVMAPTVCSRRERDTERVISRPQGFPRCRRALHPSQRNSPSSAAAVRRKQNHPNLQAMVVRK